MDDSHNKISYIWSYLRLDKISTWLVVVGQCLGISSYFVSTPEWLYPLGIASMVLGAFLIFRDTKVGRGRLIRNTITIFLIVAFILALYFYFLLN